MSIDPLLNILCYDLRPHIDYCVEIGQNSIVNVHNALRALIDKSKSRICSAAFRADTCTCPAQNPCEESGGDRAAKVAAERKERRRRLCNKLVTKSRNAWQAQNVDACAREWWDLTEIQKLIFYWMAVADEIVSEEPFENYQSCFMKCFPSENCNDKERNVMKCLRTWITMSRKKRLPFKIEACIARIASGKLDFYNERQIRNYLNSK